MANLSKILILVLFLSGCSLTSYYVDPVYEDYTDQVYFWEDSTLGTPYFGYWEGYYYYYGTPHYWPWWYYYMYRPATHYHIHTGVVNCIDYNHLDGFYLIIKLNIIKIINTIDMVK